MGPMDYAVELMRSIMGKPKAAPIAPRVEHSIMNILLTDEDVDFETRAIKTVPGDVKVVSGCRVDMSTDPKRAGGDCTQALLRAIVESDDPSWMGVLRMTRSILKARGQMQIPVLSTSRSLNLSKPFSIFNNTGNTKSLFIGINYVGHSRGTLSGCHAGCLDMMQYINSEGYSCYDEDQKIFMDDGVHMMPTAQNIFNGMAWLVHDAKAGDNLFMHYAGHGFSMKDNNNAEEDELGEVLVPMDYQTGGCVSDDDIYDLLVSKVPKHCSLTIVLDCCYSETVILLPYVLRVNDEVITEYDEFTQAQAVATAARRYKMLVDRLQLDAEDDDMESDVTTSYSSCQGISTKGEGDVHKKAFRPDPTPPEPYVPTPPSTVPNPSLCGAGMFTADSCRMRSRLR